MAGFYDELSVHDICAFMGQTIECMCKKKNPRNYNICLINNQMDPT